MIEGDLRISKNMFPVRICVIILRLMRHLTQITLSSFVLLFFSLPFAAEPHDVEEPALQELPIWKQCCADHDCVAQNVRIVGREGKEKVAVEIEGTETKVDKEKLSPVPSPNTWVCYVNPKGKIVNENIRCILFPEKKSTVDVPNPMKNSKGQKLGPDLTQER
jgi:hypothetical protein